VDFISVTDGIDTSTPVGRFTFHVVGAVAELERELIRERTRAGIASARRRGIRVGRPQARVDLARARALLLAGQSYRQVARALGIGASTIHRALKTGIVEGVPETSTVTTAQVGEISQAA
jgi:DNA invertase Pin-like site-specific DNA recombinase